MTITAEESVSQARAIWAVNSAPAVICAVRDTDRDGLEDMLGEMSRENLLALVVVLAAAIDPDRPWRSQLEWIEPELKPKRPPTAPEPRSRDARGVVQMRPCGTHAAFTRHRSNGEIPCGDCLEGERAYQRNRKRRQRDDEQKGTAA